MFSRCTFVHDLRTSAIGGLRSMSGRRYRTATLYQRALGGLAPIGCMRKDRGGVHAAPSPLIRLSGVG
jgi:hypothetical protein